MPDPTPYPHLPPRHRYWLWIWGTVLATLPLMGIFFQLSRVDTRPLIALFAPAVLLSRLAPDSAQLLTLYALMPLQCLTYGLLLGRSELTNRRKPMLLKLLAFHISLALLALYLTRGQL